MVASASVNEWWPVNAPKEIVKSFIDLVNMAKGLMDENKQPAVQH